VSKKPYTVSWFSAGVSSAVATKLIIKEIDEIIYTHIDDQHPDTMRFVWDCERWFDRPITILQSLCKTVDGSMKLFPNQKTHGGKWAPCTDILKRRVRKQWESEHPDYDLTYVWGLDCKEIDRLEGNPKRNMKGLKKAMRHCKHRAPLIEQSISKQHAHEILKASGIKRPAMYDLGYMNNNCVGCVKGNGAAYWNKIRVDFPEVFADRAKMEREIGGSIMKTGDTPAQPIYLDELDPNAGRGQKPIVDDCGIMCELMRID
jgi:hypothetical protein